MTHEALYYVFYYVIARYTQAGRNLRQYGMLCALNSYMHIHQLHSSQNSRCVTLSIMITFVLQDIQNETLSYITMHYELLIESFLILESTESMLLWHCLCHNFISVYFYLTTCMVKTIKFACLLVTHQCKSF